MKIIQLEADVKNTLSRYERFGHHPTLLELWSLLSTKIEIEKFDLAITKSLKAWGIGKTGNRYHFSLLSAKSEEYFTELAQNAKTKLSMASGFADILSEFDGLLFFGVSGSVASGYAKAEDDIDVFIITKKDRLWTMRLFVNIASIMLKNRRSRGRANSDEDHQDRFCFNLFLSEGDLELPENKRTRFVASEIYFLKPVLIRGGVYEKFLKGNDWTTGLLPNVEIDSKNIHYPPIVSKYKYWQKMMLFIMKVSYRLAIIFPFSESIFAYLQKSYMSSHITNEIITPTQLWFHPRDLNEEMEGKNEDKNKEL